MAPVAAVRPDVLDAVITASRSTGTPLIYLTPAGGFWISIVRALAAGPGVTLIGGRYRKASISAFEAHRGGRGQLRRLRPSAVRRRRSRCWMWWSGFCRVLSARSSHCRTKVLRRAFRGTRTNATRSLNGRDARGCSNPAITPRSRRGGGPRRRDHPARRPDLWAAYVSKNKEHARVTLAS